MHTHTIVVIFILPTGDYNIIPWPTQINKNNRWLVVTLMLTPSLPFHHDRLSFRHLPSPSTQKHGLL